MVPTLPRRGALRAGLALICTAAWPAARACEFFTTTLRVTHPWTRASRAGAAEAIVCMVFDQVLQDERLIAVATLLAAAAELGGGAGGGGVDRPCLRAARPPSRKPAFMSACSA